MTVIKTKTQQITPVEDDPRKALWPTYSPPPELHFSHGIGTKLYSVSGEEYLDFLTGIAVNSFGHAHPELTACLQQQAGKLWHTSNIFRVPEAERLGQRLCAHSFADQVFFTNSGTEANEAGIKAIRGYHAANNQPDKYRIIAFAGSFHGRTLGALAAAGNQAHCQGFIPFDYGFDQVPWDDLDTLTKTINDHTAGILIEPIQGEGGIRPASKQFLQGLRALCEQHDLVLMYDEVQCGYGRTGQLFAYQHYGVPPDVMALAKGMGGGFPVGACLASEKVSRTMTVGKHGSTFGGNPLAMAVANKVLDLVLADGFLDEVARKGKYFIRQLRDLVGRYPDVVSSVSGRGLMIGVSCVLPNTLILAKLRTNKLIVGKAGDNMLRFLPPLNVTDSEIDQALAIIDQSFNECLQAKP